MSADADRRSVLAGLFVSALGAPALAQDAGPGAFSSILVDVGPLRAKGLGPYADAVRAAMQAELSRAYADRLGRHGPRLVVRIDAISLRSYAGREGGRWFGGGTQNDYLEGEALVVGPGGEVLIRHPQLSALPSNSGGAWYDPDSERRRLAALAAHFAGWLRRASF